MAGVAIASPAATSPGQEPTTTTTLAEGQDEGIIPEPNSGREPEEAGDRGGALQLTVLALVLVGIGTGLLLVVRESRKARAQTS